MNLKGSKTETNLQTAFMQECQARSRYTLFSETARRGLRTNRSDFQ